MNNIETLKFMITQLSEAHHEVLKDLSGYKHEAKQKVAYVAGKVTGLEYQAVYLKFKKRQLELEALGYVVINPCELLPADCDWDTAMKVCLYLLQFADVISLLHDWQDSKGATIEKNHAEILGIKILYGNEGPGQ